MNLPPELIHQIFVLVLYDQDISPNPAFSSLISLPSFSYTSLCQTESRQSLKACSLVCRWWNTLARKILFQCILIRGPEWKILDWLELGRKKLNIKDNDFSETAVTQLYLEYVTQVEGANFPLIRRTDIDPIQPYGPSKLRKLRLSLFEARLSNLLSLFSDQSLYSIYLRFLYVNLDEVEQLGSDHLNLASLFRLVAKLPRLEQLELVTSLQKNLIQKLGYYLSPGEGPWKHLSLRFNLFGLAKGLARDLVIFLEEHPQVEILSLKILEISVEEEKDKMGTLDLGDDFRDFESSSQKPNKELGNFVKNTTSDFNPNNENENEIPVPSIRSLFIIYVQKPSPAFTRSLLKSFPNIETLSFIHEPIRFSRHSESRDRILLELDLAASIKNIQIHQALEGTDVNLKLNWDAFPVLEKLELKGYRAMKLLERQTPAYFPDLLEIQIIYDEFPGLDFLDSLESIENIINSKSKFPTLRKLSIQEFPLRSYAGFSYGVQKLEEKIRGWKSKMNGLKVGISAQICDELSRTEGDGSDDIHLSFGPFD